MLWRLRRGATCRQDAGAGPPCIAGSGGGARPADCRAHDAPTVLPERTLDAPFADKGCEACAIRVDLAKRTIEPVIPGRSDRRVKIERDRVLCKQRIRIERMFGHLRINRAIATRRDQPASSFLGMVHIATARCRLRPVPAA